MRFRSILLATAVLVAPATASAGRSFYGWLYGTEVMPERGAEVQSFTSEENRQTDGHLSDTQWWIAPSIGITDQLELLLPVQFDWLHGDATSARTQFTNYGGELRFRMVSSDPVDAPDLVPLVRVAVKRIVVGKRDVVQPEADLVVSYTTGPVQVLADVGAFGTVSGSDQQFEFHPGAGVSVLTVNSLRFGAEVIGEFVINNSPGSWITIGPNMAWSHGRTWISASYGIGIYQIRDAPRLNWGIAF